MSKKTLLLNNSYEILSFISEKKMCKLLIKDKVEVMSTWDEDIIWSNGRIKYPAILKLKYYVKVNYVHSNFSRQSLIRRDKKTCQYCNEKLIGAQITIDHILPKSQHGITSFTNCVVCCQKCNSIKANRTPEQAGMKLLKKPTHPSFNNNICTIEPTEYWHHDWNNYI